MAGAGFDAAMIRDADALKDRLGRVAYVWSGSRNIGSESFEAKIKVDGVPWFDGPASCVLLGNVGEIFGGVQVFEDAEPDDGRLEIGVVTADNAVQWTRTLARTLAGDPNRSPFVRTTRARKVKVAFDRPVLYELDGGDRRKVSSFKVKVEPGALRICVPSPAQARAAA